MTEETRAIKCDCVYEEFCNLVNGGTIFLTKPCAYKRSANDFVEVVRCKDCRYHYQTICPVGTKTFDEDFCSYGERRNNE